MNEPVWRTPFKVVLAERVLGLVEDRALPQVAEDALLEGVDSPHLGALAGMSDGEFNAFVARDLYKRALREVGLVEPGVREAICVVVCEYVEGIRSGKLAALEGVTQLKAIYDLVVVDGAGGMPAGDSLGLDVFLGLYYEITDLDTCQEQYRQPNASREELFAHYERETVRAAQAFDTRTLRARLTKVVHTR